MTTEMHPQVVEALRQAQQMRSAIDHQTHRRDTESFTGTDESKTVEVSVNGRLYLTGLHIEDGLLRLGAETVEQRINEAVSNARATASAGTDAEYEQLMDTLVDIADSLQKTLGLT